MKTCSIEGCGKPMLARSWCQTHYNRWRRTGDVHSEPKVYASNDGPCAIEDCDKKSVTRGYCSRHYSKLMRYGDPLAKGDRAPGARGEGEICEFEGCGRLQKALSFCSGHYLKVRTSADLEHLLPQEKRSSRCLAPECANPQYADGLCRDHYNTRKWHGEAWPAPDVEIEEPRSVGGRFKLERIRQGLTLNDLAERIGVTRERIRQLELSGTCTESLIHRYAEALDVSVDYLLHDTVELAEINAQADQVAAIRENRVRNYTYHGGLKERLERLEELVGQG